MILQRNKVYLVAGCMFFIPGLYASQFHGIAEANVSSDVNNEAQVNAQHEEAYKENILAIDQLRETTFSYKNKTFRTDLKAMQDAQQAINKYNKVIANNICRDVAKSYVWGFQWLAWYIINPYNYKQYHVDCIEDYAVQCVKYYANETFMDVINSDKEFIIKALKSRKELKNLKEWQPEASAALADGEQERVCMQYSENENLNIGSYDQDSRLQLQGDGVKKLFDRLS